MVRYQELDDLEAALLTVWVRAGLWLQPDVASRLLVGLGFEGLHGGGSRSAHCSATESPVLDQRGELGLCKGRRRLCRHAETPETGLPLPKHEVWQRDDMLQFTCLQVTCSVSCRTGRH